PAILGCPLIWRQWPVGYDVLTNVAIVVMRLVGLAPASVEQCNTCRHASRVRSLTALGNAHQRLDRRRGMRASERLHLGDLLWSAAWVAALALLECAWSAHLILTCSEGERHCRPPRPAESEKLSPPLHRSQFLKNADYENELQDILKSNVPRLSDLAIRLMRS